MKVLNRMHQMNINRGMTLIVFITLLYILCLETNIGGMLQKHCLMLFLFKFTCFSITLCLTFGKRGLLYQGGVKLSFM